MIDPAATLRQLAGSGNLRTIPAEIDRPVVDLTSNDYLGIASRGDLLERFYSLNGAERLPMSASASRLLGGRQREYTSFESLLSQCYGRPALAFNSGYHANVGIIQALADRRTLIVADRLVHASIIDGIRLSGADFVRFRHNDFADLASILSRRAADYGNVLVIAESVYSMDGDRADIGRLIELRRRFAPKVMLYVDEAHAVGVEGPSGLGLVAASHAPGEVDIVIGTLGKALGSVGAYAVMSADLRSYMVNRSRSLIFSTALPPVNVAWSTFVFREMLGMDSGRDKLRLLGSSLAAATGADAPGHIRPLVVGDAHRAVELSAHLLDNGFKVLPIRTPTVPPGTERLRFSLSAALDKTDIDRLAGVLSPILKSLRR